MVLKCTECEDATFENYQQGRGHFMFTEGDGHGPKNEVPDGYKDKLKQVDDPDDDEAEEASNGGKDESPSGSDDTSVDDETGGVERPEGVRSRLRKFFDTDVRELIGS